MKKKSKAPKIDPYLEGLMAKLLDRLVSLDKKMDTVLGKMGKSVPEVKEQPRRERTLYEAICADCHKVCEVLSSPPKTVRFIARSAGPSERAEGSKLPAIPGRACRS